MKIIFLDIDGVLNSRRSSFAFKGYPHPGNVDTNKFDMVSVELIRRVCNKIDNTKIVLSSTWRADKNYKDILGLPIIDKTPKLPGIRGLEIKEWFARNTHLLNKIDKWAIVDDDSDMLDEQLPYFVKINPINGLMWEDFERLIEILDIKY